MEIPKTVMLNVNKALDLINSPKLKKQYETYKKEDKKQNPDAESQDEEKEKKKKIRPRLKIINDFGGEQTTENKDTKEENKIPKPNSYYETDKNMYLYSEDTFYAEKEEIDKTREELN